MESLLDFNTRRSKVCIYCKNKNKKLNAKRRRTIKVKRETAKKWIFVIYFCWTRQSGFDGFSPWWFLLFYFFLLFLAFLAVLFLYTFNVLLLILLHVLGGFFVEILLSYFSFFFFPFFYVFFVFNRKKNQQPKIDFFSLISLVWCKEKCKKEDFFVNKNQVH